MVSFIQGEVTPIGISLKGNKSSPSLTVTKPQLMNQPWHVVLPKQKRLGRGRAAWPSRSRGATGVAGRKLLHELPWISYVTDLPINWLKSQTNKQKPTCPGINLIPPQTDRHTRLQAMPTLRPLVWPRRAGPGTKPWFRGKQSCVNSAPPLASDTDII